MSTQLHPRIEALAQDQAFINWVKSGADHAQVNQFLKDGVDLNDIQEAVRLVEILIEPVNKPSTQFDSAQLLGKINNSIGKMDTPQKSNRTRIIRLTSIAVAAVLTVFVIMRLPDANASINTQMAEQLNVDLPDGSNMILNAVTETEFSKKSFNKERVVNLKGEAFFKVEKGSTFQVNTPLGSVEVLGTSFNVFARDDKFEVSCATGKVKVSTRDGSSFVVLEAGQECVLEEGRITRVNHLFEDQDWIDGVFHYKEVNVGYVVEEIERQFDVDIEISDGLDTISYTGYFEKTSLDTALESVLWPLRLDYDLQTNGTYRIFGKQAN
ncbi:MAG: hypothetical protein HKN09_06140 [Saprospiraceae bacterium]|nr:hypothetical protein [Saprospiraceae bacterium]